MQNCFWGYHIYIYIWTYVFPHIMASRVGVPRDVGTASVTWTFVYHLRTDLTDRPPGGGESTEKVEKRGKKTVSILHHPAILFADLFLLTVCIPVLNRLLSENDGCQDRRVKPMEGTSTPKARRSRFTFLLLSRSQKWGSTWKRLGEVWRHEKTRQECPTCSLS